MSVVFGFEHRHEVQIEPAAIAVSGLAHDALVFESETFVEVASAGVVLEDVEKEAVSIEFAEGDADDLGENAAAQTLSGLGDDYSLQFDGAGILAEAAEDYIRIDVAGLVVDIVAGIAADQGCVVALFAPLADIQTGHGIALERENCRDVRGGGGAERHGTA